MARDEPTSQLSPSAFGPFRVLHQIGEGVLGPVYRTYEPQGDRLVAVKVFRLDVVPEQAEILAGELRHLVDERLSDPSIVTVIGSGVEDGVAYLAEEYVAAESLDVAMRHYAPATLEQVLAFVSQLAGALDAARSHGIGHGALHPRDVFVTPDRARVTGLGVAEVLERLDLRVPVRRPYSAPERIVRTSWGTPADVYALAAMAYELLTGRRLAGAGKVPAKGLTELLGATRGPAVAQVLGTALADDPDARYQEASAFAEAMANTAGDEPDIERAVVTAGPAPLTLVRSSRTGDPDLAIERPRGRVVRLPRREPTDDSAQETQQPGMAGDSETATMRQDERPGNGGNEDTLEAAVDASLARHERTPSGSGDGVDSADALTTVSIGDPGAEDGAPVSPAGGATEPTDDITIAEALRLMEDDPNQLEEQLRRVEERRIRALEPPPASEVPTDQQPDAATMERQPESPAPDAPSIDSGRHPLLSRLSAAGIDEGDGHDVRASMLEQDEILGAEDGTAAADVMRHRESPESETATDDDGLERQAPAAEDPAATVALGLPPTLPLDAPRPSAGVGAGSKRVAHGVTGNETVGVATQPAGSASSFRNREGTVVVPPPSAGRAGRLIQKWSMLGVALGTGLLAGFLVGQRVGGNGTAADLGVRSTSADGATPASVSLGDSQEWDEGAVIGTASQAGPDPGEDVAVSRTPVSAPRVSATPTPRPAAGSRSEPPAAPRAEPPAAAPTRPDPPRREAPAAAPGRMLVRTTPAGAEVTVDGIRRGVSPLVLRDVAYGSHAVIAALDGYQIEERRLDVTAGRPAMSVTIEMRPVGAVAAAPMAEAPIAAAVDAPGTLFVDSRPRGATVEIDGQLVGDTPLLVSGVEPGPRDVQLRLEGYRAWTAQVRVTSGQRGRVTASLDRIP